MLTKRYIFVLILLLFAIGAISSVSASDLNATDQAIGEEVGLDSELEQTDGDQLGNGDENQLGASGNGTFTELNSRVSAASSTLSLSKDFAYDCSEDEDFHGGITITKDLNIVGNDHTIYGNSARVFIIESNAQVTIRGVKFVNQLGEGGRCYSYGGSILNYGQLTLTDCTFKNSYAGVLGGAVHSYGYLNMELCRFEDNHACSLNESDEPSGGAVSSTYLLLANNCIFRFNEARYGGAIYNENVAVLSDCRFIANSANRSGGAVYNFEQCYCQVNSSNFLLNSAKYAGALYDCESNHNSFTYNSADVGNNMIAGTMFNCTAASDDNDYVYVKEPAKLSASQKTVTYGSGAKYSVNVVNYLNKPVNGVTVQIVATDGKTQKVLYATTNAYGIASFPINLVPKTYSLSISVYDTNYDSMMISSKIIIKKASSKITAKNAKFKVKKTKKYSITLKDSNGKAIKSVKVTISVGGKTYTATTNANGKATFKLSKLKKKGSFGATIKFGGNSYYNGFTKKVTIKVKK